MASNPCYLHKGYQCPGRKVGCRETCQDWKDYESLKHKEYEDRKFKSNVLSNPVKTNAINAHAMWKLNR